MSKLIKQLKHTRKLIERSERQNEEILWANIWHDTCRGLAWTKQIGSISPGRWAVGYNYLYVMTRILEDCRPLRVLDLGLGISSILISNYFYYYGGENTEHIIIEQDQQWAEFYTREGKIKDCSNVHICECEKKKRGNDIINTYKGLDQIIEGKQFDVISILLW